jgi:hypothetical protein
LIPIWSFSVPQPALTSGKSSHGKSKREERRARERGGIKRPLSSFFFSIAEISKRKFVYE